MAAYVKNKELREELIKSKEQDELTPRALEMIMLMAEKFGTKLNYAREEDFQDCRSSAIMDCWMYWRGYKAEKSPNAFAYITQMIKNGYAKGWRKLYGNMKMSQKISISRHKIYNI